MRTTIDKAGRVVVPKPIREAMGLQTGGEVDIAFIDGKVEIAVPEAESWVEMAEDGLPIIRTSGPAEPIDPRQIREELLDERTARWL